MLDEKIQLEKNEIISLLREKLPVLRAIARVSQETIANKIGISRQTYSSIETGRREMSWTFFFLRWLPIFKTMHRQNKCLRK